MKMAIPCRISKELVAHGGGPVDGSRRLYRPLGWFQRAFAGVGALVPLTTKADPVKVRLWLGSGAATAIGWLMEWAWLIAPCLLLVAAILTALRKKIGDPSNWYALHDLLDRIRDVMFSDAASPYQYHHRVTLFRYRKWAWVFERWPWDGWLLPVMRSGHTTQHCSQKFRVPDRATRAEGVAGQAWAQTRAVCITELPDVNGEPSDDDISRYAEATNVTAEWVRVNKPSARSFYALQVIDNGKPWGVIVVDSRNPALNKKRMSSRFQATGTFLALFAKRV